MLRMNLRSLNGMLRSSVPSATMRPSAPHSASPADPARSMLAREPSRCLPDPDPAPLASAPLLSRLSCTPAGRAIRARHALHQTTPSDTLVTYEKTAVKHHTVRIQPALAHMYHTTRTGDRDLRKIVGWTPRAVQKSWDFARVSGL